jgi:hypothetical protein
MTMPDNGDIVIGVEVPAAFGIVHPHALGPHDVQRLVIKEHVRRAKGASAT